MNKIKFLEKEKFEEIVDNTMKKYEKAAGQYQYLMKKDSKDILHHVINTTDPTKTAFDIFGHNLNIDQWKEFQISSVLNVSSNRIPIEFHMDILSNVDGWDVCSTNNSRMLKNTNKTTFIALRNTYHTLDSSKRRKTWNQLNRISKEYPDSTCYSGYLVSDNHESVDKIFTIKDKDSNDKIREISGVNVYSIVTKDVHGLQKIYGALISYLNESSEHKLTNEDITLLKLNGNKIF